MSHWIFRGDFGQSRETSDMDRETSDTLVSKHIMDLFYVTFYFILHIIILLIIFYNL